MKYLKTLSKLVFALILPIAILVIFLLKVNFDSLVETLTNIRIDYFALAFFLFILNVILRGLRFHYLIGPGRSGLFDLVKLQSLLSFFNNYLPIGTSEVSFVFLGKRYLKIPTSLGTAVIIYSRLYDYFTLCLIFFVYFAVFGGEVLERFYIPLAIFSLVLAIFFVVTFVRPGLFLRALEYLSTRFGIRSSNLVKKVISWAEIFVVDAERFKDIRIFILAGVSTLAIWGTIFGVFKYTAMSVGTPLDYKGAVFVSLVGFLAKFIQGVASLGSHELAWYMGLTILGYTSESAMETALGTHVLILIYPLIAGIFGWLSLTISYNIRKENW